MRRGMCLILLLVSVSIVRAQEEPVRTRRRPASDPTARVVTTRETTKPSAKEEKERENAACSRKDRCGCFMSFDLIKNGIGS